MIHPLWILAIGIAVVVGLIVVFRVNAFIALITAAMAVSLLSAGAWPEKIARVASEFGSSAGKIGVVIAMAAVIGKCLMDSGAADRIVRGFLRVLGEGRASVALMGSGFVLSIPVFFDTVFYLLVPLARSLWRRTRHNYVLYVTAIACGGAITHTLVPPTPGPLVMADNLNIDLGVMILMGIAVGLPTAAVGLVGCRLVNRLFPIAMRPYSGEAEAEPLPDDQLPPFWLSILPIVLPVMLISANTVAQTVANAEHKALLERGDVFQWPVVAAALARGGTDPAASPAVRRLWERLPAEVRAEMARAAARQQMEQAGELVRKAFAEMVADRQLRFDPVLAAMPVPEAARRLEQRGWQRLTPQEIRRYHWMLLEEVFPEARRRTRRRAVADMTSLLGDPNLALLLSAAIAMITLVRQRRLPLKELARTTETALMSGGVIILITAGGGAFGAMLRISGIKEYIENSTQLQGGHVGLAVLVLGFLVAAVMKVAQGSSTVSMITTSSMVAAMGFSSDTLGFHPVYVALAIGCGSLVGSWMNDSGFWIFARMSGFTETETLKIWTTLLIVIAVVGLLVTTGLAWLLPLS